MHVIKHAHTHRHTNTQRMGVGRVEMGVVSLLLPDCCHGDADGAFTAGWDSHFAIKMHTHGHHFSLMLAHALPLRAASPLSQLSGKQKKKKKYRKLKGTFFKCGRVLVCVCVCMKVLCLNTPVRNSTTDPPRNAHETLACCILLQHAAHCLFLSLSPPITFPYHPHLPSLTPDTPFIENDVTHGLVIASVTAGISAKTSRVNKRCKPALIFICCRCKWMNPACTLPIPHMLKAT